MQGTRISPVQEDGLRFLMLLDRVREVENQQEQMRLSILGSQPGLARGLYPGYFNGDPSEVQEDVTGDVFTNDEEAALDLRKIEWESPDDFGDADVEMLNRMLGDDTITVGNLPRAAEGVAEDLGPRPQDDDTEWT